MDITGGPSTTHPSTTPIPQQQPTMEPRGGSILGKRVAPEDDERGGNPPSAGAHPLGLGEQTGAEDLGGLQAYSGPAPVERALTGPEDQVRDAQHVTVFEQVTGRRRLH
jgi:hypothetical protein